MNTSLVRGALLVAATLTVGAAAAQNTDAFPHKRPDYRVVNLSSLGGAANAGNSINDLNLSAGFANLPDNNSRHAMLWLYGFRFDLGTLGGRNSNVPWPVKNTSGLIAGIAQTTTPQPRGETWSCRSFFAFPTRAAATCRSRSADVMLPVGQGYAIASVPFRSFMLRNSMSGGVPVPLVSPSFRTSS